MFTDSPWITNGYKKIKNPVKYPGTTQKYQGVLFDGFDFKFQTENFNKIKETLEPFGIKPTEIYFGMRANKPNFVVCFDNPDIMWQKYEGECIGSGQNYIYCKNMRFNTTHWIKKNLEDIGKHLNGLEN